MIAWICSMGVDLAFIEAVLDQYHFGLPIQRDSHSYILGEIKGHSNMTAMLSQIGTSSASTIATQLLNNFNSTLFGLLIEIDGKASDEMNDLETRLKSKMISKPSASVGEIVHCDRINHWTSVGFEKIRMLAKRASISRANLEILAVDQRIKDSRVPLYLSNMLQRFLVMAEEYFHSSVRQDLLPQNDNSHFGELNCLNGDK